MLPSFLSIMRLLFMCESPNFIAILKDKYDVKYHATGKHTRGIIIGSVKNLGQKFELNGVISFANSSRTFPLEFYNVLIVPCNQCRTCRLNKTKQKAMQVYGEVFSNELQGLPNCFITLTFGRQATYRYLRTVRKMSRYKAKKYTDFLCYSLENREYTLFQKRLRKKFPGLSIRFFHCGEYGSKGSRPHHHSIILGFDFADKEYFFTNNKTGVNYYRSQLLEDLWPFGYSTIGEVSFNSCAYVSRYVTKKVNGVLKESHYNGRKPEYCTCSNRPGIGFKFYQEYKDNIYSIDNVSHLDWKNRIINSRPPKYFDELLKRDNFSLFTEIKDNRKDYCLKHNDEMYKEACRGITHDEFITAQKLEMLNHDFDDSYDEKYQDNFLAPLDYTHYKYRSSNDKYINYNKQLLQRLRRQFRDEFGQVQEDIVKKLYDENRLYFKRGSTLDPYALMKISG